jgi:four helix bundle protein
VFEEVVGRQSLVVSRKEVEDLRIMDKIKNFRDLKIWQSGMEIVLCIYGLTGKYPKDELFSLVSQMRRAAVSIPSNIAEGFARQHNKEYTQFLYIALGSAAELETQIEISFKLGYITESDKTDLLDKINQLNRMTTSLIKCVSGSSN